MPRTKLFIVIAAVLLVTLAAGCGDARKDATSSVATRATNTTEQPMSEPGVPSSLPFLGDRDIDQVGDNDSDNNADTDEDRSEDYKRPAPKSYLDGDDRNALGFGYPAKASEARTLMRVVKRYIAAAAAGDGATACTMIEPALAASLPKDYGGNAGPTYLHHSTTCAAVMSRLFHHVRAELAGTIEVTSVRVLGGPTEEGAKAQALLGSDTLPVSHITLERLKGVWWIDGLLPTAFT